MVLQIHFTCCAFMCGVIWIIQILHYPAFAQIAAGEFAGFHRRHTRRITWVVAPVMVVELGSAVALVFRSVHREFWWANLAGVVLLWASTLFFSVPLHGKLEASQDRKLVADLVRTNWPRTLLWSLRTVLLLIFIVRNHEMSDQTAGASALLF